MARPDILTQKLPQGRVGASYSKEIAVRGGVPPLRFAVVAGALPAGLSLEGQGKSARIEGKPTKAGLTTFSLEVSSSDDKQSKKRKEYSITVPGEPKLDELPAATAKVGEAFEATLPVGGEGLITPLTWSWSGAEGTPAGLKLGTAEDGKAGKISGTPEQSGKYALTVTVRDAQVPPSKVEGTLELTVQGELAVLCEGLPSASVGSAYVASASVEDDGQGPFTWSLEGAPAWPKISGTKDAKLEGTPDKEGKFPCTLVVTNKADKKARKKLELEVFPKVEAKEPPPPSEGGKVEVFALEDGRVAVLWEHAGFPVARYGISRKTDQGMPSTEWLDGFASVGEATADNFVKLNGLPSAGRDRYRGCTLEVRDGAHKDQRVEILGSKNNTVRLAQALRLTAGTPVQVLDMQRGESFPDKKTFVHQVEWGESPLPPAVRVTQTGPLGELASQVWPSAAPGSQAKALGVAWEAADKPRKGEISVARHGEKSRLLVGFRHTSPGVQFLAAPLPGDRVWIGEHRLTARKEASGIDVHSFACGASPEEAARNLEGALKKDLALAEHFVFKVDGPTLRLDHRSQTRARLEVRVSAAERMRPFDQLAFDPQSPLRCLALEGAEGLGGDAWQRTGGGFFASVLRKDTRFEVSIYSRKKVRGAWARDMLVAWGFCRDEKARVRLRGRLRGWADLAFEADRENIVLMPLPGASEIAHSFDEGGQEALEAQPRGFYIVDDLVPGQSYRFTVEELGTAGETRKSEAAAAYKAEKEPQALGFLLPRARHPLGALGADKKPAFALAVGIDAERLLVRAEKQGEGKEHTVYGVHPASAAFGKQLASALADPSAKLFKVFGDRDRTTGGLVTLLAPSRLQAYSQGAGDGGRFDRIVLDPRDHSLEEGAGAALNFHSAWLEQLLELVARADYARRSLADTDSFARPISVADDRWLIEGLGHLAGGLLNEAAPRDKARREQLLGHAGCYNLNLRFRAGPQEALSALYAYFQVMKDKETGSGFARYARPVSGENGLGLVEFAVALVLASSVKKGSPLELPRYPKEWGEKDKFTTSFAGDFLAQEDWQKLVAEPFREKDPEAYPALWLDPRAPKFPKKRERDWYSDYLPVFPASVQLLEWRPEHEDEALKELAAGHDHLHVHFWFEEPEVVPAVEWVLALVQRKDEKWSFERQRAPRFDGKEEERELRFSVEDFGGGENPAVRAIFLLPCRRAARREGLPRPQRVFYRSYRSLRPEVLSVRAVPDGREADSRDWLRSESVDSCENWIGPGNVEVITGDGGKDKRDERLGPDNPTFSFRVRFNTGMRNEERDFHYAIVPKGGLSGLIEPGAAQARQAKLRVLKQQKWDAAALGDDTWISRPIPMDELRDKEKDGSELLLVIGDCGRNPGDGKALRDSEERPVGGARSLGGVLLDTREKIVPDEDPEPELRFYARIDNKPPKVEVEGLDEFEGSGDKGTYKDCFSFSVSAEDEASGISRIEVLAKQFQGKGNAVLGCMVPEKATAKADLKIVWNTTQVKNGKHDVIIRAFDLAGNLTCRIISVNIANFRPNIQTGSIKFGLAVDKVKPKGEIKAAKGPEELSESTPGKGTVEVELDTRDDETGIDRILLFCEETDAPLPQSPVQTWNDDYDTSNQVGLLYNTKPGPGEFAPTMKFDSRFSGDGEREIWAHVEDRAGLAVSGLKEDALVRKARVDNQPPAIVLLDPPLRVRGGVGVTVWVDEPGREKTKFKPKGFWIPDSDKENKRGLPTLEETQLNALNRGNFYRCLWPTEVERFKSGPGTLAIEVRGETIKLRLELDNSPEAYEEQAAPFRQQIRFGAWQSSGLVLEGRHLPGFLAKDKPLRWVAEDVGTKVVEAKADGKAGADTGKGIYSLALSDDVQGELEAKDETENASRAPLWVKVCKEPPKLASVTLISRGLGGAPRISTEEQQFLRGKVRVLVKTEEKPEDIGRVEALFKGEPIGDFRRSARFQDTFACLWETDQDAVKGELVVKAFNRAGMPSEPKTFDVVILNAAPEVAALAPKGSGKEFEVEIGAKRPEVDGTEVVDRALLAFERTAPWASHGLTLDASKEPLKPAPAGLLAGIGELHGALVDKAGNLGAGVMEAYGELQATPAADPADAKPADEVPAQSDAATAAAVATGAVAAGAAAGIAAKRGGYDPKNAPGAGGPPSRQALEPGQDKQVDPKDAAKKDDAPADDDKKPKVVSAKWDRTTIKFEEKAGMHADVQNADGQTAKLTIYEHDADGQHDLVGTQEATVEQGKITSEWECKGTSGGDFSDEAEDQKLLKFFFRVEIEGAEKADSGLLEYRDFIEFLLTDDDGEVMPDTGYELSFQDGSKRVGKTDKDGRGFEDNVVPGEVGLRILSDEELAAAQKKADADKKDDAKKPDGPVAISGAKWDRETIKFEEKAALLADVSHADGKTAKLTILEHDADGQHDLVATLEATVEGGKLKAEWQCTGAKGGEFSDEEEDQKLLKFFFRVEVDDQKAESGLLEYRDFIEFVLADDDGEVMANTGYELTFSDGSKRTGFTDAEGKGFEDDVVPGPVNLRMLDKDEADAAKAAAPAAGAASPPSQADDTKPDGPPRLSDAAWDKTKIKYKETAQLSAKAENADGKSVELKIFEWDADGGHDPVETLQATVQAGAIRASWECKGVQQGAFSDEEEDSKLLQFFFEVHLEGAEKIASGKLEYRDFVEFFLEDDDGQPKANAPYELILPDGTRRKGTTDAQGRAFEDDLPPGPLQLVSA